MARYFFHVINGDFVPDHEGVECSDIDDVKTHAVRIAGAMIKDQGLSLWKTGRYDMFVCDQHNKTHLRLSLKAEDLKGELS